MFVSGNVQVNYCVLFTKRSARWLGSKKIGVERVIV